MRFDRKMLLGAAAALAMTGCAAVDPGFGEALKYDMAIQTINPDPVYAEDATKPGYHGEKAQKATDRYRKGQTKPVERETTSERSGQGGSGTGGGPGGSN